MLSSENESNDQTKQKTESTDGNTTSGKKKLNRKIDNEPPRLATIEPEEYGILIIDDEAPWAGLYKTNLFQTMEQKYKFQFYTAQSSVRGVQLIAEHYGNIHIVILDLNMPRKNGIFFLETVVDKLGIESLGVFVITSYGTDEALQKCMLRGVRGFYDKAHLNFQILSQTIYDYIDFRNRITGIEIGMYIEDRTQQNEQVIYLRWSDPNGDNTNIYLGKTNHMETIRLPGLITDVNDIKNFKKSP